MRIQAFVPREYIRDFEWLETLAMRFERCQLSAFENRPPPPSGPSVCPDLEYKAERGVMRGEESGELFDEFSPKGGERRMDANYEGSRRATPPPRGRASHPMERPRGEARGKGTENRPFQDVAAPSAQNNREIRSGDRARSPVIPPTAANREAPNGDAKNNVRCYNCGEREHFAKKCPKPRKRVHCFTCGEPNTTSRDCKNCAGNGSGKS